MSLIFHNEDFVAVELQSLTGERKHFYLCTGIRMMSRNLLTNLDDNKLHNKLPPFF